MAGYLNEAELLKVGLSRPTVAALRDTQRKAEQTESDATVDLFESGAYTTELAKRLEEIATELAAAPNLAPQVIEIQKVVAALLVSAPQFDDSSARLAEVTKAVRDINVLGAFTV